MTEKSRPINPPIDTRRYFEDQIAANTALKEAIPQKCHGCWPHLEIDVIGRLAVGVANQEMTIPAAQLELAAYTEDCPGVRTNPAVADAGVICPKQQAEESDNSSR